MVKQSLILVVDDESTVREVVRKYLEHEGFRVAEADNGTMALSLIRENPPDLIILDLMLPGVDGFTITRTLRAEADNGYLSAENQIPIIILTARTNELDRIAGFDLGADDYVLKPFSPRELVGRVKAVLRRSASGKPDADEKLLNLPEISIDPRSREVTVRGMTVVLTAKEFDLLLFLARHPHQVFSRMQLLDQVWGFEFYGDESTVTVHIRRLREKIEPNPAEPTYIQTVWGVGYKFEIA